MIEETRYLGFGHLNLGRIPGLLQQHAEQLEVKRNMPNHQQVIYGRKHLILSHYTKGDWKLRQHAA
jgi:hypothetical protein